MHEKSNMHKDEATSRRERTSAGVLHAFVLQVNAAINHTLRSTFGYGYFSEPIGLLS